jgi:hypothetical protein
VKEMGRINMKEKVLGKVGKVIRNGRVKLIRRCLNISKRRKGHLE